MEQHNDLVFVQTHPELMTKFSLNEYQSWYCLCVLAKENSDVVTAVSRYLSEAELQRCNEVLKKIS